VCRRLKLAFPLDDAGTPEVGAVTSRHRLPVSGGTTPERIHGPELWRREPRIANEKTPRAAKARGVAFSAWR
jgi:hypothetical protein